MEDLLEKRLAALTQELESGQRQLKTLEGRAEELRQTLLRISGAIQVLQELRDEARQTSADVAPLQPASKAGA